MILTREGIQRIKITVTTALPVNTAYVSFIAYREMILDYFFFSFSLICYLKIDRNIFVFQTKYLRKYIQITYFHKLFNLLISLMLIINKFIRIFLK